MDRTVPAGWSPSRSPPVVPSGTPVAPTDSLHATFLAILPRIVLHGEVIFRGVQCPHRKEEFVSEMVALSWLWFLRLCRQGKDATQFVSALATFAARQVRSGRRLCGQEKSKDVLSPLARQRHNFKVEPLPFSTRRSHEERYANPHSQQAQDAFEECLRDNTETPVPEQAAFRLDFPAWIGSRSERDRHVIHDLMLGERTLDVANKHGLSPARISQLRREFLEDWDRFCGEPLAS